MSFVEVLFLNFGLLYPYTDESLDKQIEKYENLIEIHQIVQQTLHRIGPLVHFPDAEKITIVFLIELNRLCECVKLKRRVRENYLNGIGLE